MILAIDAGNSRIKWGFHDGEAWTKQSWVETAVARQLGAVLAHEPAPRLIIACNVAGAEVARALEEALAPLGAPLRWVASRAAQCGVRSSYEDPGQLGADRWAALIGAWHLFGGPCLVVNAGTTMTVDALSDDGLFLGGIIVAGAELMREALARNTAALRLQEGCFRFFPNATGDAIASGVVNALCGAIERMASFMEEAGQRHPACVLSGGAAGLIASHLNLEAKLVDNLVLEGLVRIALSGPGNPTAK